MYKAKNQKSLSCFWEKLFNFSSCTFLKILVIHTAPTVQHCSDNAMLHFTFHCCGERLSIPTFSTQGTSEPFLLIIVIAFAIWKLFSFLIVIAPRTTEPLYLLTVIVLVWWQLRQRINPLHFEVMLRRPLRLCQSYQLTITSRKKPSYGLKTYGCFSNFFFYCLMLF